MRNRPCDMVEPAFRMEDNRLHTLRLAEKLGNVAEACRRTGMDRSDFYTWRRRFQLEGLAGLRNQPRAHRSHPQQSPAAVENRILEIALASPDWGCSRVSEQLGKEGTPLSPPSVQRLLAKHGLGSVQARSDRAERYVMTNPDAITCRLRNTIETNNPCYREQHLKAAAPGELLVQDTVLLARLGPFGRIYMHVVVDVHCSYGFLALDTTVLGIGAIDLVIDEVLPFYREHGLPVKTIITDEGRQFAGRQHGYGELLATHGIAHQRPGFRSLQRNGFIARFQQAIRREVLRELSKDGRDIIWQDLCHKLAELTHYYNHTRPNPGYPNMGATPMSIVVAARTKRTAGKTRQEN